MIAETGADDGLTTIIIRRNTFKIRQSLLDFLQASL
jgi:hypothetical protein